MNTFEIIDYLQNFGQFKGVYPRDLVPLYLPKCSGIVINTDKSTEPGEHWVAVYKNKDDVTIYFDSFGLPPFKDEIYKFLNVISPKGWYYNTITFQSVYQDTCGMYCIYFLNCMFKYNNFNKFRNIFNVLPYQNDIFAKFLYKIQMKNK